MHIQVLSENLQKRISLIQHVISSKSQLPILQHILLEGKEGRLLLSATDLDVGIQVAIPAKILTEGSTLVSARQFIELINSLPSDKVELKSNENSLEVSSLHSKSTFQTLIKEEFPTLYDALGDTITTIDKDILQKEFTKVIFAASTDNARPALTGVLLKREENGFLLVATDAFRLSLKHIVTEGVNSQDPGKYEKLLVQSRVLREAVTLKDEGNVIIHVSSKNNQIIFADTNTTIIGRLIDAEFPLYDDILPSEHSLRFVFNREEMHKAVKISGIFARETDNIVRFSFLKDKVVVSANTAAVGSNMVEVEGVLEGEENEIAFNAKYLLDFFTHVEEEELVFEMQGPLNPGVFKFKSDDSYMHIIMPVRVQS